MRSFLFQKAITAIKRQTYVGGKSSFASVGTGYGYLRPLSETQSSVNGLQYGVGMMLEVSYDTDIREADKVTIDSVDYTVRGVAVHDRGAVWYRKCILVKPEKL